MIVAPPVIYQRTSERTGALPSLPCGGEGVFIGEI